MKEYGKGGGSLNSVKGMCSSKNNPMPKAKMTEPTSGMPFGSPANPDQAKVRKLRAKAYMERDSLRGANGI
tara:strand:+ start:2052 stop:2264 length:213 start_codon:yes stop_codon:yes gene_type:complete